MRRLTEKEFFNQWSAFLAIAQIMIMADDTGHSTFRSTIKNYYNKYDWFNYFMSTSPNKMSYESYSNWYTKHKINSQCSCGDQLQSGKHY